MTSLGNGWANGLWEAGSAGRAKPGPRAAREEKEAWIRAKYEAKEFLASLPGSPPLHEQVVECVCRGDARGLASLLPHVTNALGDPVNTPLGPRDSRTPLHLAAAVPSLACVQLLLWHNADVSVCDSEGRSCLFYSRTAGDPNTSELLLQAGCPDNPASSVLQQQQQHQHASNAANTPMMQSQHSALQQQLSGGSGGQHITPVLHSSSALHAPGLPPITPSALPPYNGQQQQQQQASTLPRRKGSISRKPEMLDKLQASVI